MVSLAVPLVEFIGSFIFIAVIFQFASKEWGAFPIGLALTVMVLFGGAISGGHFNPAVSLAMYLSNKLELLPLLMYVVAQLLGGGCAHLFTTQLLAI